MQLKLASQIELQVIRAMRVSESQPPSAEQTEMVIALSAAGEELQRLRRKLELCGCGRQASGSIIYCETSWPWCGRQECIDTDEQV